jgi:hypothetical protein
VSAKISHACPKCKAINKAIARFCFDCGEPLMRAAEPMLPPEPPVVRGPAAPGRVKRTGLDRVMMFMLLGSAAFAVLLFARASARQHSAPSPHGAHRIQLDLGQPQNRAMQDLFAEHRNSLAHPSANFGDSLWIAGDSEDLEAVDRFVDLVRRAQRPGKPFKHGEDFVRRTYRLSREDAAALARVLSFTDWSVRFTHDGETLRVVAPKDDQKVIESVVSLLDGDDDD